MKLRIITGKRAGSIGRQPIQGQSSSMTKETEVQEEKASRHKQSAAKRSVNIVTSGFKDPILMES
jgi:hypothetical protein